jgi:hypothetical protein
VGFIGVVSAKRLKEAQTRTENKKSKEELDGMIQRVGAKALCGPS